MPFFLHGQGTGCPEQAAAVCLAVPERMRYWRQER